MNSFLRLIAFGTVSGLVWGVAPLTLLEMWQSDGETLSVLLAGILTGIAVTRLLVWPLCHSNNRWRTVAIGAASLPLGAFLFGVIGSSIQLGVARWLGVTCELVKNGFQPLHMGVGLAGASLLPMFAIVFLPLAVTTTLLLHRLMRGSDDSERA